MPLDLDEIFSYRTVRLAEIRDYRIGIPYYIIVVIICVDIFVVDLIMNGGYLARETAITGSVRLTIQEPTGRYRKSTLDLRYCLDDCFPPDDCSGDYDQAQVQCPALFSNAAFAKYPALEGQGAAFITTRVDSITEELPRHCLANANDATVSSTNALNASTRVDCYEWHQIANRSFYISQIEDYLIKVDHAMLAPTIRETKSGYDMASGAMLSLDEEELAEDDPQSVDPCWDFEPGQYWAEVPQERRPDPLPGCPTLDQFDGDSSDISGDWSVAIGANGADDVFPVSALLRAAGVNSLSDPALGHLTHPHTVRHAGIVLLLRIHYDNTWATKWWIFPDTTKFRYRYQVLNVPDSGYEVSERVDSDGTELRRTVNHRRGIRIVVKQTGEVGSFSLNAALVTCTTSLGLFAVAKLIIDLALEYMKRESVAMHRDIKFHYTEKTTGKQVSASDLKRGLASKVTGRSNSRASNLEVESTANPGSVDTGGSEASQYEPPVTEPEAQTTF